MRTRILLIASLVALAATSGVFVAHAGVIGANDARGIALEVLSQRQDGNRLNSNQSDIQLTHTRYSSLSPTMPVLYIFNDDKNGGWVIVAAEDRAERVLGYNLSVKVGSINPFSEPQWGQNPLNPQMWLFYRYRKFTSFSP